MKQFVFLKITTYYSDFLLKFYKKNTGVLDLSYNDHFQLLMNGCFGWSNYFQTNLKKMGYESYELIVNDEFLQKKWAKEHNINYRSKNWFINILLSQIDYYKPNIIIWEDPSFLNKSIKETIDKRFSHKIINIGNFCSLHTNFDLFKNFEIIIGCSEFQQYQLKKVGIESPIFRHAFEPTILNKIEPCPRSIDVTFIGSVSPQSIFSTRYNLMEYLLKKTNIEIWTFIPSHKNVIEGYCSFFYNCIKSPNPYSFFVNKFQKVKINRWKKQYPGRIHPAIYGIDMYSILAKSKITVNCHGNAIATGKCAANMRLFEATGMGALLITDWKKNLSDIFEPDKEVITYKTPEECAQKIQYYLDHEKERDAIARAGQERTLKEHTYYQRMQELIDLIQKNQRDY